MHPGRRQGRRTLIGVLLILGTAAVAAFIILLDDLRRALTDTYTIVGVLPAADAVDAGTPVWIAGRPVGDVTRVELLPRETTDGERFAATLRIPTRYSRLVRRDSDLGLARPGLLGDPVVNLMPGSSAAPALAPGDTLVARVPPGLDQVRAAADTLRRALDSLAAEGRALRSRARARAPAVDATLAALRDAGDELDALTAAYRQGPLADFLADTAIHASLDRIRAASDEIAARADARLARLRDPALAASLRRLRARAATLRARADTLRAMLDEPRGFLGRWRNDPALRDAMTAVRAQLDSLIAEARSEPWRWVF
ncbi:MAG TPA: MlaD family protein [Longimicrobiales bacterium]